MICENIRMFDAVRRLTGTTLATSKLADLYLLSALVACQTFSILAAEHPSR